MPRTRALIDPVTVWLDDEAIPADRGEPVAVALIAAGRAALARSPKFHRPRGPACLAGACDGCLARVDDVPNVMTCRVPAAEGLRIETQNVVGSRETDLLRATDWFFPDGMNHHELLAGVPGLQRAVQEVARQVAGIGRLPGGALHGTSPGRGREGSHNARRRDVDALVVGAGAAGMATAVELARRGRRVEVVDDDLAPGGSAGVLARLGEPGWAGLLEAFGEQVARGSVVARSRTTAAGIYGDDVLVASDAGAGVEVVTTRTLVLAPGCHDGAVAFEGNDLPGVMSARAGCRLLAHGVRPGHDVVVVEVDSGPFGAAFVRAWPEAKRVVGRPLRAAGRSRVKGVVVATDRGERELSCDALLVDVPGSPSYTLGLQAGAAVTRTAAGFALLPRAAGRIRDGVFVVGEACGTKLDPTALQRAATALADLA
jgi:sarcosine oxidase subunit alpha